MRIHRHVLDFLNPIMGAWHSSKPYRVTISLISSQRLFLGTSP
jgi:hypothetical protein